MNKICINYFLTENVDYKKKTINDEENSPGSHGRVGDSHCINTPGCQTVKFLWTLHAKCQWKANGGRFHHHL